MTEGLPWGYSELVGFKEFLHRQVDQMLAGRGVIKSHDGVSSEASYGISETKARRHRANIDAFHPSEPVIADHKAEAVRIVYEGMLAAGVVAPAARRRERVGFRG